MVFLLQQWKHLDTVDISTEGQGTVSKAWTPSVTASSTTCKIKVTATDAANNVSANAISGAFSVLLPGVGPTVSVTAPNATGISWSGATTQNVTWTANQPGDTSAKLDYMIEFWNGSAWATIANMTNQTRGSKTFSWTVPNPASDLTACKIRVTATVTGTTISNNDESDNNFTITHNADALTTYMETIPLYTGWNLISLPLIPVNTNANVIMGSIAGYVDKICLFYTSPSPRD